MQNEWKRGIEESIGESGFLAILATGSENVYTSVEAFESLPVALRV